MTQNINKRSLAESALLRSLYDVRPLNKEQKETKWRTFGVCVESLQKKIACSQRKDKNTTLGTYKVFYLQEPLFLESVRCGCTTAFCKTQVKLTCRFLTVRMQWIRSIFGAFVRTRRLVGTDLQGNKYYETIREGNKPKREMITKIKHMQYTPDMMPIEWEAWIRGKRDDPPTHEELLAQQRRIETVKERARQVEEKDREQQALEHKPPQLVAQVGHAATPLYESLDNREEPTSTGTVFKPGEWTPESRDSGRKENEDTFEPESWVPPGNHGPDKGR